MCNKTMVGNKMTDKINSNIKLTKKSVINIGILF